MKKTIIIVSILLLAGIISAILIINIPEEPPTEYTQCETLNDCVASTAGHCNYPQAINKNFIEEWNQQRDSELRINIIPCKEAPGPRDYSLACENNSCKIAT